MSEVQITPQPPQNKKHFVHLFLLIPFCQAEGMSHQAAIRTERRGRLKVVYRNNRFCAGLGYSSVCRRQYDQVYSQHRTVQMCTSRTDKYKQIKYQISKRYYQSVSMQIQYGGIINISHLIRLQFIGLAEKKIGTCIELNSVS